MTRRYYLLLAPAALCLSLLLTPSWSAAAVVTRLQDGESLTVAAIGTSLTATTYKCNWFAGGLATWLDSLGPGTVTMDNHAVQGSASSHQSASGGLSGLEQLAEVLPLHPDVLFIEFGMNDAYEPYAISLQTSKDNLKSMIDQFLANGPSTEVVVQTMNNCRPGTAANNDRKGPPPLADFYQGYRDVISDYYAGNPRVVFVDNYPDWIDLHDSDVTTWNSYMYDDAHPNDAGGNAITIPNIQEALLAQSIPEPGTLSLVVCGLMAWLLRRKWK